MKFHFHPTHEFAYLDKIAIHISYSSVSPLVTPPCSLNRGTYDLEVALEIANFCISKSKVKVKSGFTYF